MLVNVSLNDLGVENSSLHIYEVTGSPPELRRVVTKRTVSRP